MDSPEQRIKIAVQKTGRLTDHSLDLLERCGLKFRQSKDQLFCYGENMPVDLLLVRDDDIPGLVSDDVCDLGIVGLNIVEDKRHALQNDGQDGLFKQVFELDFRALPAIDSGVRKAAITRDQNLLKIPVLQQVTLDFLTNYLKTHDVSSRHRVFVRRRRNRAQTGPGGLHLRPGVYRIDADRERTRAKSKYCLKARLSSSRR